LPGDRSAPSSDRKTSYDKRENERRYECRLRADESADIREAAICRGFKRAAELLDETQLCSAFHRMTGLNNINVIKAAR
jgi:hypothetical protein